MCFADEETSLSTCPRGHRARFKPRFVTSSLCSFHDHTDLYLQRLKSKNREARMDKGQPEQQALVRGHRVCPVSCVITSSTPQACGGSLKLKIADSLGMGTRGGQGVLFIPSCRGDFPLLLKKANQKNEKTNHWFIWRSLSK